MSAPVRLALEGRGAATHTGLVTTDPNFQPMMRLFDGRDIEFLRTMPGQTEAGVSEFRRRRCRIFRGYLLSVRAEFLEALTDLETRGDGPEDRRELAFAPFHYRLQFAAAMIPAYVHLFRYRWGLGNADLTGVVQRFDTILEGLRHWLPQVS